MGKKSLSPQAIAALEKTSQYLSIGFYSPNTVRNYLSELRYLFAYYADVDPVDFTENMITLYLVYLSKTMGCSRVKWLHKVFLFLPPRSKTSLCRLQGKVFTGITANDYKRRSNIAGSYRRQTTLQFALSKRLDSICQSAFWRPSCRD